MSIPSTAIDIANAAAARGYAKRERMRQEYPGHALLTDWARSGGLEVAAVTVDGKKFGKSLPDAEPISVLIYASEIAAAAADGRIRIAGQWKDKRGRLQQRLAPAQEAYADV